MSNPIDLCIEILRNSNDGDDLSISDLKTVEMVVNGRIHELTNYGLAMFNFMVDKYCGTQNED